MNKLTKFLLEEISRLKAKNKKLKKKIKKFKSADDKETSSNLLENNSLENILESTLEYPQLAIAYTDGSFSQEKNTAGYGIIFFHNGKTYKESGKISRLKTEKLSSQSSETFAVIRAIDKAILLKSKTIIIYYDCTSITEWADNVNSTNSRAAWYYKHLTKRKKKINVIFRKVKAHSGDLHNTEADQLAKKAIA